MSRYRNESEFNREWSAWLEAAGAKVLPLVGSTYQPAGWPDRHVSHRAFVGWVEGKKDDRQLTAAQRIVCKELCERGDPALELKLLSDVEDLVVKSPWGRALATVSRARLVGSPDLKPGRILLETLAAAWEDLRGEQPWRRL